MDDFISKLRAAFNFERTPDDLGDGGVAFASFLNFAAGDSTAAEQIQLAWFQSTGKAPRNDMRATADETGSFIDWLIVNHWGEAEQVVSSTKH